MYCFKCGNELVEGSVFCNQCGNKVQYNVEPDKFEDNLETEEVHIVEIEKTLHNVKPIKINTYSTSVTHEDLKVFVGPSKQKYYMSKWSKFEESIINKSDSWNWAAFFLTLFWMAYRKMYLYAVGISAAFFIITSIFPGLATPLGISLGVFLGMFGNKMYYEHARKVISKVNNNIVDLSKKERIIASKGGSSIGFAILFTVVYLGIAFVFGMIEYYAQL